MRRDNQFNGRLMLGLTLFGLAIWILLEALFAGDLLSSWLGLFLLVSLSLISLSGGTWLRGFVLILLSLAIICASHPIFLLSGHLFLFALVLALLIRLFSGPYCYHRRLGRPYLRHDYDRYGRHCHF